MDKIIKVIEEMIAEYQIERDAVHAKWEAASNENRGTEMVQTQERIKVLNERIAVLLRCKNAWRGLNVPGTKD